MKWLQVTFALACVSCGPTDFSTQAPEQQRHGIVGGTLTSSDPSVVAIGRRYNNYLSTFCTGTLIAPRTVLTAAHCVDDFPGNGAVGVGPDSNEPQQLANVTQAVPHPDYGANIRDFAVLRLDKPLIGITPLTMNEAPMSTAHVGLQVRHVGYGLTSATDRNPDNLKREVTYNIRSVQNFVFESGTTGKQTCSGDSGGPAFAVMPGGDSEVLIGVVSYGDQFCSQQGYDGRVDVVVPWVRATMAAWETPTCAEYDGCVLGCTPVDQDCECAADGVCGANCATPANDPDCPTDCAANGVCSTAVCGQPDPDCVQVGSACTAVTQCVSRQCINSPQRTQTYCSKSCAEDTDCPDQMECSNGTCLFTLKPEKQHGDECTRGVDYCAGGDTCTGPVGGLSRCVKPCTSAANCANGESCVGGADSQRYCRAEGMSFAREITLPAAEPELGEKTPGCSTTGVSALSAIALLLFRRRRVTA